MNEAAAARTLERYRKLVERRLERRFAARPERLREAMRYSLLAGGKRIRPMLVLAAGDMVGAPRTATLPFACGIEMIHTYSLVHDDLPAMDDDDERRGRPTSHRVFGEGLAILVGDALLTEAFAVMTGARGVPPARVVEALACVARAAGEVGMVGGQALDLAAEGAVPPLDELRAIHAAKTGALIRASVQLGAILGGARPSVRRAFGCYGAALGLCFQITDDLLDAAQDGGDDRAGKATYPAVLGMAEAERHARRAARQARAALGRFGARAAVLTYITRLVEDRIAAPPAAAPGA
ncbi:MAG TPA: farnesyl diphosphate synthase [Vicinamibacterales bacterium]|nr:farnesyl diphosphate synthase [Vicinamibacterales bacterium]